MNKEMAEMIMPVFIDHAFNAKDTSGEIKISAEVRRQLMGIFSLELGEVAALSYLAERRVEDELTALDLDVAGFPGEINE